MPGTKYHKVQKNVNLQSAQQDHSWPGLPEVSKFQSARHTLFNKHLRVGKLILSDSGFQELTFQKNYES